MCSTREQVQRPRLGEFPQPQKPTDRERKLRFISTGGRKAMETAVVEAMRRAGADNFLTDEQLDEIVSEQVEDARAANQRQVRNRQKLRLVSNGGGVAR